MMIERATRPSLALGLMDERLNDDGDLSERNSRQYIALNNSLTRTLVRIVVKDLTQVPNHDDHIIPLSRGGQHVPANIQITAALATKARGARPTLSFGSGCCRYEEIGR